MEAPSPARPDLPENLTATQSEPDSCEDTGEGMAEEMVKRDRAVGLGKGRGQGQALTALGDVTVLPRQLAVLQHVAPRLGIPVWIPR